MRNDKLAKALQVPKTKRVNGNPPRQNNQNRSYHEVFMFIHEETGEKIQTTPKILVDMYKDHPDERMALPSDRNTAAAGIREIAYNGKPSYKGWVCRPPEINNTLFD